MTSYNFEPERMRPLHAASGETLLDHDGRNVANILSSIQADDQHSLSRIQRYFTSIAPAVELAEVKTDGDYATAQFRIRHSGKTEPLTFDAWHMSDGTLRALGALVAVFQTARTFGPPSLVAIEEPEAALHPAAMRALMAAFDEATMRTQILLTTHSPDILDAVEVKPENVRVVQMIDGQTVIGTVDEASVNIVSEHLSSLGELERERQLEPNQDDLRRQADLARRDSAAS
jgi:predicted ATPase